MPIHFLAENTPVTVRILPDLTNEWQARRLNTNPNSSIYQLLNFGRTSAPESSTNPGFRVKDHGDRDNTKNKP